MFKFLAAGLFGVPARQEKELHNNQIHRARQVGKQELTSLVNRVEVIDETGRAYIKYLDDTKFVWLSYQDNGRTLKVFVDSTSWKGE